MAQQRQVPVTQRAYTLRLSRAPGECAACHTNPCDCWREALWATHDAVNKGAKAFGDWLLTLRGGLCHTLADRDVPAKGEKPARKPTDEERRDRRVLLALSWLSVEDERGAPNGKGLRVATGRDTGDQRREAVEAALREILEKRGVKEEEIKVWLIDCGPSLEARIREDAVWVNRSAVFDEKVKELKRLTREYAQTTIMSFFGRKDSYFALPATGSDDESGDEGAGVGDGPEFRTLARQWASTNFGTGEKSDTGQITKQLRKLAQADLSRFAGRPKTELIKEMAKKVSSSTSDLDGLRVGIGWSTGRSSKGRLAINKLPECPTKDHIKAMQKKLAEEADEKKKKSTQREVPEWMPPLLQSIEQACGMPFVGNRDHIGEFSVMLDHAARRVSIAHSWIKRAEQRRREFEQDARKLTPVQERAPQAVEWLNQFCADRSTATGASAEAGYRIRKRAVEGWSHVVKAWSRPSCKTEDDRIAAAREVQAEPEIEKFGDIQLFEALATDEAVCVWRGQDGNPDASILTDYVAGTTAEHNQKRFKVPAYRHPDALQHPVFCDFGNSRWSIRFAIHDAVKAQSKGKGAKKGTSSLQNRHGLRMGLWNGGSVDDIDLHWSSKRLTADLALDDNRDAKALKVTRADRLGRAASGAVAQAAVMNVFEEKEWNGRLQAPRAELDRIAKLEEKGKRAQAETLRRRLRWLVSFSPRLRPSGPFIDYAKSQGIEPNRRSGEYYPNAPANKGREGLGKLALSRLPGLRVLSVDLGHRFAAACAVWEAPPLDTFKRDIRGLKVLAGGSGKGDIFLHVEKQGKDGKLRTLVYRRIGPDSLPGGASHPAPWARLDRQFLIKLQGEEAPARWAARQETDTVRGWEKALGRVRDESTDPLPHRIDALMSEAVTTLRRALHRHGDRARIAFNLTTTEKLTAGGGRQTLDHAGRVELLLKTLVLWYGLFSGKRWADQWAADEWKRRGLPEIAILDDEEDASAATRRARRNTLEEALKPHAQHLAGQDLLSWSAAWTTRWRQDDAAWSGKNGILRALKLWIAPRGLRPLSTDDSATLERKKAARAAARYVGGLSITRINTISGLYQLLKAFKMRPEADDPRKNIPQKGDDELENFNRRLLDMRDRLREQRVKQLASRIVEAALGIGRIKIPKRGKAPQRPRQAVDAPCHAVVIESLTHYRPDDLRTRRENRQLMQWSSAKVQQYLAEGCQIYGLHLREVPANYTSRQCSRTGLPGVRCDDVPAEEFLTSPWWNKTISAARKKLDKNGTDDRDRFLVELADRLKRLQAGEKPLPPTVRVPRQGGDLFVAAPPCNLLRGNAEANLDRATKRAVQADLNAAANIGLRALLDPDWPGRWWYVPCKAGTSAPASDRIKGSAAFENVQSLPTDGDAVSGTEAGKGRRKKDADEAPSKEIKNLWRDPSTDDLASVQWKWKRTQAYWNDVQSRVVCLLRKRAGLDA